MQSIVITGDREARTLLDGIAGRLERPAAGLAELIDDVFVIQRRYWDAEFGGKTDKQKRRGRDPRFMQETGGLHAAATRRGAAGQHIETGPEYLFVTLAGRMIGLAEMHRKRGREVFGEPSQADSHRTAEKFSRYILTGH